MNMFFLSVSVLGECCVNTVEGEQVVAGVHLSSIC